LAPRRQLKVAIRKHGHVRLEYPAVVVSDDGVHLVVRARWAEPTARDAGFVRFEPGDIWTEHYWRDRWYSIKEVRDAGGVLKGWYADVLRPVRVGERLLVADDLDLDLWVSADRGTILRLDEDEFVASGVEDSDPAAAEHARRALEELERLADQGFQLLRTAADRSDRAVEEQLTDPG
jgi:predicted RNA-binding protein associated with RNAse of E/G family